MTARNFSAWPVSCSRTPFRNDLRLPPFFQLPIELFQNGQHGPGLRVRQEIDDFRKVPEDLVFPCNLFTLHNVSPLIRNNVENVIYIAEIITDF